MSTPIENASSTPARPSRSLHRLSIHPSASTTTLSPATPGLDSMPSSPSTDAPETQTSTTLQTPRSAHLSTRKSIASIKRKPVPICASQVEQELSASQQGVAPGSSTPVHLPTPTTPYIVAPPTYILPVDPPRSSIDTVNTLPPSYVHHGQPNEGPSASMYGLSVEDLPRYAEETQTEPKTLARSLWLYGFLLPLLWIIGSCILCIPLKPVEEEADPEKAQKLEEMITILRKTELKYAKRCLYALCTLVLIIAVVVVIAVVVGTKH